MKILNLIRTDIKEYELETLRRNIVFDNICRGRIFAFVLIGFELVLGIVDIISLLFKVDNRFQFDNYLIMYLIMILTNIAYLFFINKFKNIEDITVKQLRKLEIGLIIYLTFIMSWGSIISLMDQKLYGQLMVFMVNMITCSVLYFLDNKKILVSYFFPVIVLLIGLPYFQDSKDILIGHYVNLIVFLFISWVASRIIYLSYCRDFRSKALLENSKKLLNKEIEQNIIINNKLTAANLQLKELALIDELTGIPNRRSFRNYIDVTFEKYYEGSLVLSFIMMDIDFFKQFNDNYGHNEGDKVLFKVANEINSIVKHSMDFVARWGGEEFLYVAFNTDEEDIAKIAETIRRKVCELKIPHEYSTASDHISVSIGTYSLNVSGKGDVSKGIELADKALYFAKESGRNCVRNIKN